MKPSRRDVFRGSAAAMLALGACSRRAPEPAPEAVPEAAVEPGIVRVASVRTAVEGRVLPTLIELFERRSTYRVRLMTGTQVYDAARNGNVDLVISHYGHKDAEQFVLDGLGEWPRTIFSNQMALVGPPEDPAKIRGLEDAGEAFRRIAEAKSTFLINDIDGVRYLTEVLWNAAGCPDRTGWLIDAGAAKDAAIAKASELGAYSLWGLTPFLRLEDARPLKLEPLVLGDPLLQRMLVSVIVKPSGARRINTAGAMAFQTFLLEPATQAAVRTVHYPGPTLVSWVPAGRHNRTAVLPKT
jgi:tungstate transport system substrate-binding protein